MGRIRSEDLSRIQARPFWPFLDASRSGTALLSDVWNQWEGLVADETTLEPAFQTFISEHAGLFFGPSMSQSIVISKLRLGRDHEIDFVAASDQRSLGLLYELIEIETPHVAPYTKAGNPGARLTHAIQQIDDWRHWLSANSAEAKRLFPSREFILRDQPFFSFTIVIGRRENSELWLHKRNALSARHDVTIRSFDWFTDTLKEKQFRPIASEFTQMNRPSIETLHDLANPFWIAFTDGEWAQIRKDHGFEPMSHMIESNVDILLKHRRLSYRYRQFLDIWERAPVEERDDVYREYLEWDML